MVIRAHKSRPLSSVPKQNWLFGDCSLFRRLQSKGSCRLTTSASTAITHMTTIIMIPAAPKGRWIRKDREVLMSLLLKGELVRVLEVILWLVACLLYKGYSYWYLTLGSNHPYERSTNKLTRITHIARNRTTD